jgi:hypothetical protein
MNKMHTLAKIALATIGIYTMISLLYQLLFAIHCFFTKPLWETAGSLSLSLLVTTGLIFVLLYLFFYKNDSLAKKIVGSEQLPEPESQIQWLPVALRLISIAGGLYFLITVLGQANHTISQLAYFKYVNGSTHAVPYYPPFNYNSLLPWIVMFICGVYLLCGAPHFVRWHVKKILQQCKDKAETK